MGNLKRPGTVFLGLSNKKSRSWVLVFWMSICHPGTMSKSNRIPKWKTVGIYGLGRRLVCRMKWLRPARVAYFCLVVFKSWILLGCWSFCSSGVFFI
jgi:hypothetical protein